MNQSAGDPVDLNKAPTGALQLLLDSLVPIVAALIKADDIIKKLIAEVTEPATR